MAMTFKSCAWCQDCDDLLDEMTKGRGFLRRIQEQIEGCFGPQGQRSPSPSCAGKTPRGTWAGHNRAIEQSAGKFEENMKDFKDNDCGDKSRDKQRAASIFQRGEEALDKYKSGVPGSEWTGPALSTPTAPKGDDWPSLPPPLILPFPPKGLGGGGGGRLRPTVFPPSLIVM